jgi:CzcA family heavy metal efflux pump
MKIGISSDVYNQIELSTLAWWKIRARLLQVEGVANVPIWGRYKEMLHIEIDPVRLAEAGVTQEQVMQASSDAFDVGLLPYLKGSRTGNGGFIDMPNQRIGVTHVLPIADSQSLAEVVVAEVDGKVIRVGDVADVVVGHQPLIGDAVINDGEGLMMVVEKLPWGNTLDVTEGVEEAIREMAPGLTGVQIDTSIFRPATFVEVALHNLFRALTIGLILVAVILTLFLFNWRSAVISLVAIPMSLVAAGLVLWWRDTTVNTMVLAGLIIAVGVVVDDAIIDIENIMRRLRQAKAAGTPYSTPRIILEASIEVRSAIIFATLIDAVAVIPVFFMEGLTGAFFRPLAVSYALAVLASMVVAMTVTPAMAYILFHRASDLGRHESPIVPWLKRRYNGVLSRIVRRPQFAYGAVVTIAAVGLLVYPTLGRSLLPEFKERDFLMHWITTPGTSHPEMIRITTLSSVELRSIPGVRNFGAHIGQAEQSDEPYGMNFGENWISVAEDVDYEDTLAAVNEVVEGYPGLYRDVQTYLKERIREVLAGSSKAIVIRIYGEDLYMLREKAAEVEEILAGIEGTVAADTEIQVDIPQIQIQVDLEKAKAWGIKPGDVRRAAGTLLATYETADYYTNGKVYDIRVVGTEDIRHSLTSVQNIMLDSPYGGQVRLTDVATVALMPTPNDIRHINLVRKIDVSANVEGRDLGSIVDELNQKLEVVEWPLGYHAELLGEFEERQAASDRLRYYAIAAGIGIFLLLVLSFQSVRLGILSFLTLPSALVGGVLAAYLGDGIISLGALVGFLTVLGIAARNGIMMITHFQHLEREEGVPFGPALVLQGAQERLSPILMTALATGLALVPLVWAGSIPGHEIEHPMAVVILGGLVTSTLLNLFLVPSLYLRFGKSRAERATPPSPPAAPGLAAA